MDCPVRVAVCLALVVVAGCLGAVPGDPDGDGEGISGTNQQSPTDPETDAATLTPVATPHPSTAPTVRATVVDVVDGDTVKVRFENGSRETVRLLGVDTPEVHAENTPDEFEGVPSTDAGRACLREYGAAASAYASDRLDGRQVQLGFDDNEGRRGYYGRLLAYVYVDGEQFNYALVAEGYARMYDSRFVDRDRYAVAEANAQSAGRGVWGCGDGGAVGTATDGGTPSTPDVTVAEIVADAPGNDNNNLDGEYVVLSNQGAETVDLSGWTVSDEAGHEYRVPDGTTLSPGASVRIVTGSGTDGDGRLYWGRTGAVWNNGGDTVTVRDASGTIVAERSY
jgi:micrococcal nuclease